MTTYATTRTICDKNRLLKLHDKCEGFNTWHRSSTLNLTGEAEGDIQSVGKFFLRHSKLYSLCFN